MQIQDGGVSLEALSGTYVLRLAESDAARLSVLPQSEPFTLPSREETIAFAAAQTRLVLHSVDEDGNAIAGAAYDVTDSAGQSYAVTTDETGRAVTPPMAAGEATIATQSAPEDMTAQRGRRALPLAARPGKSASCTRATGWRSLPFRCASWMRTETPPRSRFPARRCGFTACKAADRA